MSDDTLNTCDAPFGESFTEYLARQEAHQRGQAQAEIEARDAASLTAETAEDAAPIQKYKDGWDGMKDAMQTAKAADGE
jgi:hypothetical protein